MRQKTIGIIGHWVRLGVLFLATLSLTASHPASAGGTFGNSKGDDGYWGNYLNETVIELHKMTAKKMKDRVEGAKGKRYPLYYGKYMEFVPYDDLVKLNETLAEETKEAAKALGPLEAELRELEVERDALESEEAALSNLIDRNSAVVKSLRGKGISTKKIEMKISKDRKALAAARKGLSGVRSKLDEKTASAANLADSLNVGSAKLEGVLETLEKAEVRVNSAAVVEGAPSYPGAMIQEQGSEFLAVDSEKVRRSLEVDDDELDQAYLSWKQKWENNLKGARGLLDEMKESSYDARFLLKDFETLALKEKMSEMQLEAMTEAIRELDDDGKSRLEKTLLGEAVKDMIERALAGLCTAEGMNACAAARADGMNQIFDRLSGIADRTESGEQEIENGVWISERELEREREIARTRGYEQAKRGYDAQLARDREAGSARSSWEKSY